ncbi:MAG: GNAT family N-acetyltransferase [Pseudomonadota bacterium]
MGAPLTATAPIIQVRAARRAEARTIARLTDIAGEGLASHLWSHMAGPNESALSVGTARAARCDGAFSWRNARTSTWHGAAVGIVIDYDLDDVEPPGADVPPLLRPLCALEAEVAGTRYINVLAVCAQARRRGVASALIADVAARTDRDMTLIMASGNDAARAFYVLQGFEEVTRRPMGPRGPKGLTGAWCLMRRPGR